MIKVTKGNRHTIQSSVSTIIHEYQMDEPNISGSVAKIHGRYPETGFAVNEVSKEIVYITQGSGKLIQANSEIHFEESDVLFIDKNELFAWQGIFPCSWSLRPNSTPNSTQYLYKFNI